MGKSIVDTIAAAVMYDLNEGMSQVDVAHKYRLTQQAISMLLHGKKKWELLSLATFAKMFPNAELILNASICGNPADTSYPVIDHTQPEMQNSTSPQLSLFDRAMLEEWGKLDQQDKCRVMGFIAQLDKEKKSDRATTA